ncbi:MAG TPA: NDP-sugar synthase [Candidatus Altiarchaeales archaeon]|nr:NDP-sugar synthase [Candidatus Altiarchaeales archaeon]
MKAVILAGGYGTRMRPLTFSQPKPLVTLAGKPIIAHIIDYLASHGISEVFVTTNYLRESIQDYLGFHHNGVKINYPVEEEPLGTAGCVKNIQDSLDETFLVIQGDCITDMDLKKLFGKHKSSGALATIATYPVDEPWKYGVVDSGDDGCVRQFFEKPDRDKCVTSKANTGVYVLEPEVLDYVPEKTFFDFARNLFPMLLESQSICECSYDSSSFWIDVGHPKDYYRAHVWLMDNISKYVSGSLKRLDGFEGDVFAGSNVVINSSSMIEGPVVIQDNVVIEHDVVIKPYTSINSGNCLKNGTILLGSILFKNSVFGAGSTISQSMVGENSVLKAGVSVRNDVLVGADCVVGARARILEGSRIWPGMDIDANSIVDGTLRNFVQTYDPPGDIMWSLREVTPEEAFYFNKKESNRILYTGLRAKSLSDFTQVLREVDLNSIEFHLRYDNNDFQKWVHNILDDPVFAGRLGEIKKFYDSKSLNSSGLRKHLVLASENRLRQLVEGVRPKGYW